MDSIAVKTSLFSAKFAANRLANHRKTGGVEPNKDFIRLKKPLYMSRISCEFLLRVQHALPNQLLTSSGKLVEVQGPAEEEPFTKEQMAKMMDLAEKGIQELLQAQSA